MSVFVSNCGARTGAFLAGVGQDEETLYHQVYHGVPGHTLSGADVTALYQVYPWCPWP